MTGAAEVMLAPSNLPGRLAFSPDGALLAAGAAVVDPASGRVLRVLRGQLSPVTGAAFAPGGTLLATGSFDGTVRIWDTATGAARTILADLPHTVSVVEFAPDGTGLLTVADDGALRRLDIAGGTATAAGASAGPWEEEEALAVSPGGRLLATAADGGEAGIVQVWDTAAGAPRAAIAAVDSWADPDDPYELRIPATAFSPDGAFLATASMMGRAYLWDAATGAPHATLTGHDRGWAVVAVAFSPDGTLVATGSMDWTGRLWDASTGTLRATLTCEESVFTVAFSADGTSLATVCGDRTIWICYPDVGIADLIPRLSELGDPGRAGQRAGGGFS